MIAGNTMIAIKTLFDRITTPARSAPRNFFQRCGIRECVTAADLSFRDFLVILATEQDELLDVHFRPQYLNLLWPVCRPHFVGRMENMPEVVEFLAEHAIRVEPHQEHATQAVGKVEKHYSAETIGLVRTKYAADFEIFSYSTDIGCIDRVGRVAAGPGDCEPLLQWIIDGRTPYDLLDDGSRNFERFHETETRDAKLEIVAEALEKDDNWGRMQKYAAFALNAGEFNLAQESIEKIKGLQTGHFSLVENTDIFAARPSRELAI